MKHSYTFLIAVLLSLAPAKVFASGGPDAYGYTWTTSLDVGGPAYSWVDISSRTGVQTVAGLADDNSAAGMIGIGFSFHYYWSDYTQLKVGSNGWLSFNNVSNIASCFPTIPTAGGGGDNLLAPLMGDLNFTGVGNPGLVKYWTNNIDSFVISYINVPYWAVGSPGYTGSNSFQVILNAADSSIKFQYGSLSGFANNAACVDLSVGIENSTGNIGLQVHSDATPPNNYAILFDYPATVLLSIQDATPRWNQNSGNLGAFILQNVPTSLTTDFANAGNTNITTLINLQATVTDAASTTVLSTTGSLPSLAAADDTVFTFTTPWTPTTAGQYTYTSSLTNSQDINSANNSKSSELEVMNPCTPNMLLSYLTTGTPNGSLNWNGGANDDGAAVYFRPPVYPYTVSALQYYISSNAGDNFIAKIYDDDGPNGGPGTMLFSATIPAGSITTAAWNTVTVTSTVTLSNGGFYVVWLQGGTTIFLGTETAGPRSLQNYEILDNSWAQYRSNDLQDLAIRAGITGFANLPTAAFSSSVAGQSVNFTDNSTGLVTSWSWDFGDSQTSTQQSPAHMYASTGTYTVCLTAISPCGTNQLCQAVNICIAPIASYSSTTNQLSASFTDLTAGTVSSWQWDFGDSQTSTQQSPTHVYASPGTYNVCLVTTNLCGDADTICQQVTVCANPVAAFGTSANLLDVTFTDMTNNSPVSWEWDFGDSQTSVQQNPMHSYATPGTYTVCLVATNLCGDDDTICQAITVCQPPVATFMLVQNEDSVFVSDNSTGSVVSWLWDFGDGNFSTQQNDTNMYATGGSYTVCLTTTDACGNVDSTCQQVFILITSIENSGASIAAIYPNPAGEQLTIVLQQEERNALLEIVDVTGRVVQSESMTGLQRVLDVRSLPAGAYLLRMQTEQGTSVARFVKQ